MRLFLPLLLLALVAGALYLRRRRHTARHTPVPAVDRAVVARTATHVRTTLPPADVLEAAVEDVLAQRTHGRAVTRYAVVRRDARSVELALHLVEQPQLGPVTTVLLEADPAGDGTAARFEVLDVLAVDGIVDRLAEVIRTRELVLRAVLSRDPDAELRDELLDLDDYPAAPGDEPGAAPA